MTEQYRWTHGRAIRRRHRTLPRVEQGEVFVPTVSERRAFSDRMEPAPDAELDVEVPNPAAGEDADDAEAEDDTEAHGESETDADDDIVEEVLDAHWATAVSTVEAGEVDEYLEELQEEEDRDSVLAAIDTRLSVTL